MEPLPQELQNLEQQLRSFVPQAPQASPEQLLYQAGWEAALAQHTTPATTSPAASVQKSPRHQANYYWAAACAALALLSTALGWQVWHPVQPGATPSIVTTTPGAATEKEIPEQAPSLVITPSTTSDDQPSALASYLELRQRVTRGGLSMWSVSAPVRVEPGDEPVTNRDWQAELLREAL